MIALAMKKDFSFVIAEQLEDVYISLYIHPSVCKYFNRDLIYDSTCRNAGNQQVEIGTNLPGYPSLM